MNLFENNGAEFSNDKFHRYRLWRIWDKSKPLVMFIGLNPSKADGQYDDATIRRVKGFGRDHGYGGVYMCNLFTFISTDPSLLEWDNINNERSDNILMETAEGLKDVVFCWGNFKVAESRLPRMLELFPDALCLGKNVNGSPKHPCRLAGNTKLLKFNS